MEMPKRLVTVPMRLWNGFVTRHPQAVISALSFALLIALGVAVSGWTAARNAEQRVTRVEILRQADLAAQEQGQKIAQVATCFNAAKSRPLLTTILRALAAREFDPAVRAAFDTLINQYENSSVPGVKGTPTHEKCHALAARLGIDPTPYEDDR